VGELVEDGEEGGYPLWGVDELGHYRDVAADREEAVTVGRMLQRLGSAISAELTAIESIERRGDENRRIRHAVAVGFVSALAIPASLSAGRSAALAARSCASASR